MRASEIVPVAGYSVTVNWSPKTQFFYGWIDTRHHPLIGTHHHELGRTSDPNLLYEEVLEDFGMWTVGLLERVRQAPTLL